MAKLVLGSAQFGLRYGATNNKEKISNKNILKILNLSNKKKIKYIDTSGQYGNSEKKIGSFFKNKFNTISKIPRIPKKTKNISEWIFLNTLKSINNLKIKRLYGILLHDERDLVRGHKYEVFKALKRLKEIGLVKYIGVSVYDYNNLKKILFNFKLDIVQGPINIFDQRALRKDISSLIKKKKIKFFARSIFLQGMLLSNKSFLQKLKNFSKYYKNWQQYENWLKKNNFSKLQGCVNFIMNCKNIDYVIVGFSSYSEFAEIVNTKFKKIQIPKFLKCHDTRLINPLKWYIKGSKIPLYKQNIIK
jgi:aryl-alcohol dehydrogenase-like predicted oxidoreductase